MNNYATPDPEKAEHINVPATGEVQALWAAERIAYYICSACHQTKYEAVPANGHKWDSGKVTKAAGCETVG